jgi:hypothetical protein
MTVTGEHGGFQGRGEFDTAVSGHFHRLKE